jgi:hypothetical protein
MDAQGGQALPWIIGTIKTIKKSNTGRPVLDFFILITALNGCVLISCVGCTVLDYPKVQN